MSKRIPEKFGIMLGANIRSARLARGMTQGQLAQLIGVGKSVMCQYENGHRVPNVHRLSAIANAFGILIDGLVPEGDWRTNVAEDENQMSIFDIEEE